MLSRHDSIRSAPCVCAILVRTDLHRMSQQRGAVFYNAAPVRACVVGCLHSIVAIVLRSFGKDWPMPYSLTVEPAWVRAVFFGELTAADLRALAAEVRTIERARPVPHNRLNDLSEVSGIQLTYADMFDYIAHRRGQWRTL